MAGVDGRTAKSAGIRVARVLAALAASLMMSACAQVGLEAPSFLASNDAAPEQQPADQTPRSELEKATEYWGKEYQKNPRSLDAALSYAKNLKALGQKQQAMAVLQQASILHGSDRQLASEYGRLALEMDQLTVARRMLEVADDPANPDWRVILARGTVLAKEGKYQDAIGYFERANVLAPDHPSIMNNLALAYTMNGDAAKGEELLRKASTEQGSSTKVRQNLALVLGLQGKYQEATQVGAAELPPAAAEANAELLRKIVNLPEQDAPTTWEAKVADAHPAAATPDATLALKPSAVDQSAGTSPNAPARVAETSALPPRFKPSAQ